MTNEQMRYDLIVDHRLFAQGKVIVAVTDKHLHHGDGTPVVAQAEIDYRIWEAINERLQYRYANYESLGL